jgi:hypothetical protein
MFNAKQDRSLPSAEIRTPGKGPEKKNHARMHAPDRDA